MKKWLKVSLLIVFILNLWFKNESSAQSTPRGGIEPRTWRFALTGGALVGNEQLGHSTVERPLQVLDGTLKISPIGGRRMGGYLRYSTGKTFGFETGIIQVTRRWGVEVQPNDAGPIAETSFRMTSYEIPAVALLSLQTSKNSYLRGNVGMALELFASSVARLDTPVSIYAYRNRVALPSGVFRLNFEQGIGPKALYGAIALGVFYQRHASNIFYYSVRYRPDPDATFETSRNWLKGHTSGIELRYWMPLRQRPAKVVKDPFREIEGAR